MSSPAFSFFSSDVLPWLKNASVVIAAAALPLIANYTQTIDMSTTTGIVTAAGLAVLGDFLRKWATKTP